MPPYREPWSGFWEEESSAPARCQASLVQGRRVGACASLLTAPGLAGACASRAQPQPCPAARDQQPERLTYLSCPGTGRGRDTQAGGDEESGARSAARLALAQCRALSVDCAGPGSPRRLYLSVQVSTGGFQHGRVQPGRCACFFWASATGSLQASGGKERQRESQGPAWCLFAKLLAGHPPARLYRWSNLLY